MLNPRVPKCDEDFIKLDIYIRRTRKTINNKLSYMPQYENNFGYLGAGEGGGLKNQTGPILVHIYPLLYINVKHGSNLIRTF